MFLPPLLLFLLADLFLPFFHELLHVCCIWVETGLISVLQCSNDFSFVAIRAWGKLSEVSEGFVVDRASAGADAGASCIPYD